MSVTKTRREDETTLSLWDDGPCGFDAGDANLRRVVGNDPTNATDPTGLASIKEQNISAAKDYTVRLFAVSSALFGGESYLGMFDPMSCLVQRNDRRVTRQQLDNAVAQCTYAGDDNYWDEWFKKNGQLVGSSVANVPENRVTSSNGFTAMEQLAPGNRQERQQAVPVMKAMAVGAVTIPAAAANPAGAPMTTGQAALRGALAGTAAGLAMMWANSKAPARAIHIVPGVSATIGEELSEQDAVDVVRAGGDVIARTAEIARNIAAAAGDGTVDHDEAHRPGEHPHFHPKENGVRVGGHVLY